MLENRPSNAVKTDTFVSSLRHELGNAFSELETGFEHLSRSQNNLEDAHEIHQHGLERLRGVLKALDEWKGGNGS